MSGVVIASLLGIGIFISSDFYPETPQKQSQNNMVDLQRVVIAAETSLLPATVWIAEEKGFFQDEGLDVIVIDFDSGRNALETMLHSKTINISTVAQTPIVFSSFSRNDFVVVANMVYSYDSVKILALRSSGIETPSDLEGKRIGVTLRSTGHYFLDLFLSQHGLSINDVDLKDVNAAELPIKIKQGQLDAITSWEPHIFNTQKDLGDDVILFESEVPFRKDFYFAVNDDYAQDNKEIIKKFLSAVITAEEFIENNQDESKTIIGNRLGIDRQIIDLIWENFEFSITLEQSILSNMEDEARWVLREGYFNQNEIPNYLEYIDYDVLDDIKPEVVGIIR